MRMIRGHHCWTSPVTLTGHIGEPVCPPIRKEKLALILLQDALATDAVQPDNLYIAAGMYTNSWDYHNGSILKSRDKGMSFTAAPLPFKIGGNMPGRGMGERLAIDPNNVCIHPVLFSG